MRDWLAERLDSNSRLSSREIQEYRQGGVSMAALGTKYGISPASVSYLIAGKTYKTSAESCQG